MGIYKKHVEKYLLPGREKEVLYDSRVQAQFLLKALTSWSFYSQEVVAAFSSERHADIMQHKDFYHYFMSVLKSKTLSYFTGALYRPAYFTEDELERI